MSDHVVKIAFRAVLTGSQLGIASGTPTILSFFTLRKSFRAVLNSLRSCGFASVFSFIGRLNFPGGLIC